MDSCEESIWEAFPATKIDKLFFLRLWGTGQEFPNAAAVDTRLVNNGGSRPTLSTNAAASAWKYAKPTNESRPCAIACRAATQQLDGVEVGEHQQQRREHTAGQGK